MKTTSLSVTTTLAVLLCALQTRLEAQATPASQVGSAAVMNAERTKVFRTLWICQAGTLELRYAMQYRRFLLLEESSTPGVLAERFLSMATWRLGSLRPRRCRSC